MSGGTVSAMNRTHGTGLRPVVKNDLREGLCAESNGWKA